MIKVNATKSAVDEIAELWYCKGEWKLKSQCKFPISAAYINQSVLVIAGASCDLCGLDSKFFIGYKRGNSEPQEDSS